MKLKDELDGVIDTLMVKPDIVGFNGVMLTHKRPAEVFVSPSIESSASSFLVKGFVKGLLRYPSRDSKNYHFTQLWSPPSPGVFTFISVAEDNSGNRMMSAPATVTATYGVHSPSVNMTSPMTGSQRSVRWWVELPPDLLRMFLLYETEVLTIQVKLLVLVSPSRGFGYVTNPTIDFLGSGYGATAEVIIEPDANHPKYGQVYEVRMQTPGRGYFGPTEVLFWKAWVMNLAFFNADAIDTDGEVDEVTFLVNGRELTKDLTSPYCAQDKLAVGYYEFVAMAKDDAGNIVASEPTRLNISTIRGSAPSGFVIYPLPEFARDLYENSGRSQDYFGIL